MICIKYLKVCKSVFCERNVSMKAMYIRMATDTDKIDPILESCVDLIKKEWDEEHEDHFNFVINRTGISPIFEHLKNVGKL